MQSPNLKTIPAPSTLTCLLCNDNLETFPSKISFYIHLTVTHFKRNILALLEDQEPPYKCFLCDFQSSTDIYQGQQLDQLLMHLGCDDLLSLQLYEKAIKNLPQSKKPQEVGEATQCQLCGVAFSGGRMLSRHLTLMHFYQFLESQLPTTSPFSCPVSVCGVVKNSKV